MSKMSDEEYKKRLWEFFADQGGVKGLGMAAAQGWYIRKEKEFRELNKDRLQD